MKWFRNPCRRREDVSLLAADVLSGDEKNAVERHVAECAGCRTYYKQLSELAAPLAGWEKDLASIEVTQTMRTRWAKAVQQGKVASSDAFGSSGLVGGFLRTVWRELFWPSRYAWSGVALVWGAILIVNVQLSDHSMGRTSSSPQEIMQAWQEQNHVFAEWTRPSITVPAAPAYIPRPHSQRDEDWAVI
jgi:anti-sigma factor RsiW